MFEIENVAGIAGYEKEELVERERKVGVIYKATGGKVFLKENLDAAGGVKTVEVRTDGNLAKLLKEKYETVMESRYFGRGGIEVVMAGQLEMTEVYDLVRLSYNMSLEN